MTVHVAYFMQSPRLGFREWQLADVSLARELWGDNEVTRLISARPRWSDREIRSRLLEEVHLQSEHGFQYWPVFRLEDDSHVGCCGLRPMAGATELGVHIRSEHWRHGYAREAAQTVIDYAFGQLGEAVLVAGHHPDNVASRSLFAQLGFVHVRDEYYAPTGRTHPTYELRA